MTIAMLLTNTLKAARHTVHPHLRDAPEAEHSPDGGAPLQAQDETDTVRPRSVKWLSRSDDSVCLVIPAKAGIQSATA